MKINYIAELNLPTTSAYSIHVMKMCNALVKLGYKTDLYIFNKNKNINLYKYYNCEKKFNIAGLNLFKGNNFFIRIYFAIKIFFIFCFKSKKDNYIISRSILSALLLSLISNKVLLELHHEIKGFSKIFFNFFSKFIFFRNNIKFIFISRNLYNYFKIKNIKYLILDDAVDLNNFKKIKYKKFKKTCAYTGSFSKGKGVEKIIKIASFAKEINFHLYGDLINSEINLDKIKSCHNVFYKGYCEYNQIPKILKSYDLLLLPYSKKVFVRSKNIEVGNYMSPLKLFDYLASKKIILAKNMQVYNHILTKKNSILINSDNPKKWAQKIKLIFNNQKKYSHLKQRAFNTAKKYTWQIRVKKIIGFFDV
jgi:hypothetical protein